MFFRQINLVRAKFFCEKVISRNFCGKMEAVIFRTFQTVHGTVWKNEKITLTEKIFHQINSSVKKRYFHEISTAQCTNVEFLRHSDLT